MGGEKNGGMGRERKTGVGERREGEMLTLVGVDRGGGTLVASLQRKDGHAADLADIGVVEGRVISLLLGK